MKKNLLVFYIIINWLTIGSALGQIYSQEWISTYGNDSVSSPLNPIKMCSDKNGFVYVVSEKDSSSYSITISLTKFNPSGNIIWNRIYANSGGFDVRPKCITCDRNNNILIGGSELADYLILKYDSSGNFLWKYNYNAVGGYHDEIEAIETDSAGNVYVTGSGALSAAPGYWTDVLTLKINPSGALIWDKYYNYPTANSVSDKGYYLKLTKTGEVIVGGNINGSSAVCKYDSLGNLIWTSSPLNFPIADITLDDSSNIYLASKLISQNLILAKYSNTGILQWNKTTHFSNGGCLYSLALKDNFIYAAGYTFKDTTQKQNVILLKFNLNGDSIWTRSFNGTSNLNDVGRKVLADNNGNIIVVGTVNVSTNDRDILTLKFDTAGVLQWQKQDSVYLSVDTFVDAISDTSGNIYSLASTFLNNQSRKVSKMNSTGNYAWTNLTENFQNRYDAATKLIIDYQGNIITGGISDGKTGNNDIVIIKYSSLGNTLWKRRIHDTADRDMNLHQILSDSLGNIYVCGRIFFNVAGAIQSIAFTSKITSSGAIDWLSINDSLSVASSMAFDGMGNIYEIGLVQLAPYLYNSSLVKYDAFGNILWTKHFTDSCAGLSQCILADQTGNFFVAQTQVDSPSNGMDITLIKTDSSGTVNWRRDFNGPASSADVFTKMVLDGNKNPILIGNRYKLNYDMVVLKYDNSGNPLWNYLYAGSANKWDLPNDIAIDLDDNIYVTGRSDNNSSNSECATFKLDPSGNLFWQRKYISSGGSFKYSQGYAICTDKSTKRVIVVGETFAANVSNIMVLVYDSTGNQVFFDTYNQGVGSLHDNSGNSVVCDQSGSFYLAGVVDSRLNMTDYATIRYSDITLNVKNNLDETGSLRIFPNPTKNSFNISYGSNSMSNVTIQILNTLGMQISEKKHVMNKGSNSLIIDANGLSPGVYFLRLVQGEKSYIEKLIVE